MRKIIQGIAGLIVGAIWGNSVMWAGALYFPNSPALLFAFLITLLVALLLWRKTGKIGAVCLIIECLVGPYALFSFLMYSSSIGAPL